MIMTEPSGTAGFWQAVRQLPGRTPLRVKLISALLALVAVALAVISIAGISVLKSYQLGQADNTLQGYAGQSPRIVQDYLLGAVQPTIQTGGTALAWLPAGGSLHWVISPGVAFSPQSPERALPVPAVPTTPAWLAANEGKGVTVTAVSGNHRWRVVAFPRRFQTADGTVITGIVIVGMDVTDIYTTIGHLIGIDLIVSLITDRRPGGRRHHGGAPPACGR